MSNEVINSIVDEVHAEKIVLFGSHAKGNANEDSDIDLLVIEKEPFKGRSRRSEINRVRDRISKYGVPVDILIYDKDEIEEWKNSINHIIPKVCEKV